MTKIRTYILGLFFIGVGCTNNSEILEDSTSETHVEAVKKPTFQSTIITSPKAVERLAYAYQQFDPLPVNPWIPSQDSVDMAENLMQKYFSETEAGRKIGALHYYLRQYVGYINSDNEKVIWVQCFHRSELVHFEGWETKLINVMDGGSGFFQITINLATQECLRFGINSVA